MLASGMNVVDRVSLAFLRFFKLRREGDHGLKVVAAVDGATRVAVVFIHGLNGDPSSTWGFDAGTENWSTWIRSEEPDCCIVSVGYRAASSEWRGGSMPIYDRAVNVIERLRFVVPKAMPIIIVAHSYGGLLAKQIVRVSAQKPGYRDFVESIRGIMFLGTPHSGARTANWMKTFALGYRTSRAVEELVNSDPYLLDLGRWFRDNVAALKIDVLAFLEHNKTLGVSVVEDASGDPGIAGVIPIKIDETHSGLARPCDREDIRVKKLNALISSVASTPADERERSFHQALQLLMSRVFDGKAIEQELYEGVVARNTLGCTVLPQDIIDKIDAYRLVPGGFGQTAERLRVERQFSILSALSKYQPQKK